MVFLADNRFALWIVPMLRERTMFERTSHRNQIESIILRNTHQSAYVHDPSDRVRLGTF